MKIFLTDDSLAIIDRLREMLSTLPGFQITGSATDAPEALRSIRNARPDAVILDLELPTGSGLDLLWSIKLEMPGTIVVVLTNHAFPQYRKKCVEAGADAFLDKSTQFTEVPQVLRQLGSEAGFPQGSPAAAFMAAESETKTSL